MSIRETIAENMKEYNVYRVTVDKDATLKGRPARKVELFMNNPKGENTGRIMAEFHFTDDLGLDSEHALTLMRRYIDNHIGHYVIEVEA